MLENTREQSRRMTDFFLHVSSNHFQVTLWSQEGKVKTVPLGPGNFFEFSSLGLGDYRVLVESTSNIYKFKTLEHTFSLTPSSPATQHLTLNFNTVTSQHDTHAELNSSPLFGLIFVVLLIVAAFNWKEVCNGSCVFCSCSCSSVAAVTNRSPLSDSPFSLCHFCSFPLLHFAFLVLLTSDNFCSMQIYQFVESVRIGGIRSLLQKKVEVQESEESWLPKHLQKKSQPKRR